MGHVAAQAVMKAGGVLEMVDPAAYQKALGKMQIGEGEEVTVIVMTAADAKRHHQLKWYWGYIVKQSAEHTGYSIREMDDLLRVQCLPPGVITISQMTYDEMRDFVLACEVYAAQTMGVEITGPDDIRKRAA